VDLDGPKESCVRWGPDPPWELAIWGERGAHCKASAVSCAKMAELIEMPFGMLSGLDLKEPRIRWGYRSPMGRVNFEGEGHTLTCRMTLSCELCKNG